MLGKKIFFLKNVLVA